jgi:histidinol dehydrogenase
LGLLKSLRNPKKNLAPILEPLAEFEGLLGHRDAVQIRLTNK